MKIVPPARKLPVWPLMAMIDGSASTNGRIAVPLLSSASV